MRGWMLALVLMGGVVACGGSSDGDEDEATRRVAVLQFAFQEALDSGKWGALYQLYSDPDAEGNCSRSRFISEIELAIGSMTAGELEQIIAAFVQPPNQGELLTFEDDVMKWAIEDPEGRVSTAEAVPSGEGWLFRSPGGPCADFFAELVPTSGA
jgi:hypothetical protein